MIKDDYQKYHNFEYNLFSQARELRFDTKDITIKDFLNMFKKNKKNINVKYPINHNLTTNNFLNLLLLKQGTYQSFVITEDWNFVIGYNELKMLYRWMYKGYPLIRDDQKYYYANMAQNFKDTFENTYFRVRIYSEETNINTLIRNFFGQNFIIGAEKIKKERAENVHDRQV